MISKERILELVEEFISDKEMFVVDIDVEPTNKISVLVDSVDGVRIDDCVNISRHIEGNLDREAEDFELKVSSAGLDQPFKVIKQYEKNIGKDVEIVKSDGLKIKGVLLSVTNDNIVVEEEMMAKIEGKKKKQLVKEKLIIDFKDIKTTKVIITFK